MGGGTWTTSAYSAYTTSLGRDLKCDGSVSISSVQDAFKRYSLDSALNPLNKIRECKNSEEHPNAFPVILALDVTGSMGATAKKVAEQLNPIMTEIFKEVKDVQIMVMGIGDFAYDEAPLQVSQFESDIRIAEQLDKVYFEGGGGGNAYESYTAAWYFASRHTELDYTNSGGKGILITIGDEPLNPYLPKEGIKEFLGDNVQDNIETKDLYKEICKKFNVYHLDVNHNYRYYQEEIDSSWKVYLDDRHYKTVTLDSLKSTIVDIVLNNIENNVSNTSSEKENITYNENGEICW